MQKLKFVMVCEGEGTEVNCAIPELLEIVRGYGLTVDLIKEGEN